jgi:hypothetical protein
MESSRCTIRVCGGNVINPAGTIVHHALTTIVSLGNPMKIWQNLNSGLTFAFSEQSYGWDTAPFRILLYEPAPGKTSWFINRL